MIVVRNKTGLALRAIVRIGRLLPGDRREMEAESLASSFQFHTQLIPVPLLRRESLSILGHHVCCLC